MSLKLLAEDDRPREKFLLKGRNSLSDAELLAIIMGSGNREETAVGLARRILQSVDNNWHQLSRLSVKDLMKFNGVGEAKAISIASALEIGRRRASQEVLERKQISCSRDAFLYFQQHLSDLPVEEFWAMFVNQNNKVIHIARMTSGGITNSMVDVRTIFRTALEHYATAIFVAHNHPSGNLNPSESDRNITKQIAECGKMMNISLLDHLILAQNKYLSFADEGWL